MALIKHSAVKHITDLRTQNDCFFYVVIAI